MALAKHIAFGRRSIKDGSKFDQYFEIPTGKNIQMGNNPILQNVENIIPAVVNEFKHEAKDIAAVLYDENRETFLRNIWEFMFNYIQYDYDEPGREQFRTPYRSWSDRKSGIDCDCFSIFISSILTLYDIPHYLRITSYDYNPQFQHIYIIAEKENIPFNQNENSTYYTIDAVVHRFNTEKVFTQQKTYFMKKGLGIVTEVLNGIGDIGDIGVVSGILNGTGLSGEGDNLDEIYQHLVSTRNWAIKNPDLLRQQGHAPESFMRMIDYAIENFYVSESVREKAFENLALAEGAMNKAEGFTEEDLESVDGFEDDIDNFVDDDDLYDFDGLGDLGRLSRKERKKRRKQRRKARKTKRKKKKEIRHDTRSARKHERKQNQAARKKERKEAKGFFRKLGVAVKQGGKAVFVKANPAVIASRTGFLTAVRLNMFKLATRLKYAYKGESAARKAGVNYKASLEMAKEVENIFVKLGGKRTALRKAVLMSKTALNGFDDEPDWEGIALEFSGVDGLAGAGAITAVLSSVPILVKVINAISTVEDKYGLEGLGFGTIYEDAEELDDLMFAMDGEMHGLEGLDGEKITADMVIAWIKKFFAKVKERRAERQIEKEGMSKDEWKDYKKKSRIMKRDEKRQAAANTTEFNQFKTRAAAFTKSMKDEEEGDSREIDTSNIMTQDIDPRGGSDTTNDDATSDDKKKKTLKIILGVLGGLGIVGGGIAIANSQKKKKQKALEGLNKSKKTTKVELK